MNSTTTRKALYATEFSAFTRDEKSAIRIALWSRVVEMEREGNTDSENYKVSAAMFDYLDYELNQD